MQTARLYLRNLCRTDVDTMFEYRNDIRCSLYQRYEDTSRAYLREFVRNYSHCTFLSKEEEQHYAIVRNTDHGMIGDLSVFFSEADHCFTLGITIAPAFQRQGFAQELLKEVVLQLQEHHPSADIAALVEKDNTKSISLFKSLNFVEECYADSIRSYVFILYGKAD